MFLLKVLAAHDAHGLEPESARFTDASSARVIRDARIGHAGVTAGTTVDRISGYSRRQRQGSSDDWVPVVRRQT